MTELRQLSVVRLVVVFLKYATGLQTMLLRSSCWWLCRSAVWWSCSSVAWCAVRSLHVGSLWWLSSSLCTGLDWSWSPSSQFLRWTSLRSCCGLSLRRSFVCGSFLLCLHSSLCWTNTDSSFICRAFSPWWPANVALFKSLLYSVPGLRLERVLGGTPTFVSSLAAGGFVLFASTLLNIFKWDKCFNGRIKITDYD